MNFFKKFFKELIRKPLKLAVTEGEGNFAAKFNV